MNPDEIHRITCSICETIDVHLQKSFPEDWDHRGHYYYINDQYCPARLGLYIHSKNRLVCSLNSASNESSACKHFWSISHWRALDFSSSQREFPSTTSETNRDRPRKIFKMLRTIESIVGPLVTSICKWRRCVKTRPSAGTYSSESWVVAAGTERRRSKWIIRCPKSWHVSWSSKMGRRLSKPMNNSERFGAACRRDFNDWYSRDECKSQTRFKQRKFDKTGSVVWTRNHRRREKDFDRMEALRFSHVLLPVFSQTGLNSLPSLT